jgi:hypothetical protein
MHSGGTCPTKETMIDNMDVDSLEFYYIIVKYCTDGEKGRNIFSPGDCSSVGEIGDDDDVFKY